MFIVALNVIVLKVIIMLRLKEFSESDILSFPLYCFSLFLCIVHLGRHSNLFLLFFETLHSGGYIFPLLLCLSLLFSAMCKTFLDNHFAFLHFFFFGMILVTTYYTLLQTSVHSSSGTLSIKSSPLSLFLTSTV